MSKLVIVGVTLCMLTGITCIAHAALEQSKGLELERQFRYLEAVEQYKKEVKKLLEEGTEKSRQKEYELYFRIGYCYHQGQEYKLSVKWLKKALRIAPDGRSQDYCHSCLAMNYAKLRLWNKMMKEYKILKDKYKDVQYKNGTYPYTGHDLGLNLIKELRNIKDDKRARILLEELLVKEKDNIDNNAHYHYQLAIEYRDQEEERSKIIEELIIGSSIRPADRWTSTCYELLGQYYYQNKRYDKAIEALKNAIIFSSVEAYTRNYQSNLKIYEKVRDWSDYPLQCVIKSEKKRYAINEAINIELELVNQGNKDIYINTYFIHERHIDLTIIGPDGTKVQSILTGIKWKHDPISKDDFIMLRKGQSYRSVIKNLRNWDEYYELTGIGDYSITATYTNKFDGTEFGLDMVWLGKATSNTITIKVVKNKK